MRVGIIGGGITGLTVAYYLQRAGVHTTILESEREFGGLVRTFDFGPFHWDKFYHAILTSDADLLTLLEDLGLSSELRWTETKTGFYSQRGLHSMSNSLDFLRFPVLSIWEKLRLGLGILYSARLSRVDKLEEIPVVDWLVRIFGRGNYEKMWGPLLKCKLGACREEASAAFIYGYISRYYSTRQKGVSKKEMMGYVRGSYRTVLTRLVERLQEHGAEFMLGCTVERLERSSSGRIRVHTNGGTLEFDRVVFTGPSEFFARVAADLDPAYVDKLLKVKYLGVVCAALLLKRALSPFYVTNLVDPTLPFTGVIEMTSMASREETAGRHLVYLPKYTVPGDPTFGLPDEEIWRQFKPALIRMHPDLRDEEIEKVFIFRARHVQPIPVLRYSHLVPSMETGIPGLYLANTTFIINKTLSNNQMVHIALRAVGQILGSQRENTVVAGSQERRNAMSAVAPVAVPPAM